jgi:hypothetical protein
MADISKLPLAINMVGPMVFHANLKKNPNVLEVWLPDLSAPPFPHEAGIITGLDSKKLDSGSHQLDGPTAAKPNETPSSNWPDIYCPQVNPKYPTKIYNVNTENITPTKYIYIQLPIPRQIVSLAPVLCQITYDGETEDCACCATGVRLLYGAANHPTFDGSDLPIDVGDQDQQVEVSIIHHPVVHDTKSDHPEATSDWSEMGKMLGIDWDIDFNQCDEMNTAGMGTRHKVKVAVGAVNDCVVPLAMY